MKIRFNDNTEINGLVVNGSNRFFQNAQRDSLEFVFAKGLYTFEELEVSFSDRLKTIKMTIVDDNDTQYVYNDYVLRVSMSLSPVVITPATSTTPEVIEERISIIMAQQTYMEKMVEKILG